MLDRPNTIPKTLQINAELPKPKSLSGATLDDWLAFIEKSHPSEIELGLDRIRLVYERLGLKGKIPKVVTVAGTNGKGTTTHCLDAIARHHGLKTGLYTSPHLINYNERVSICGEPVTDQMLVEGFEDVQRAQRDIKLTYFEYGTLCALSIFAKNDLDLMILEVGLGGRLDAVNVVDPDIAAISSIGLDHCDWLGSSRDQIGIEKAGIIRPGIPVVCTERDLPDSVEKLFKITQSKVQQLDKDFGVRVDGNDFDYFDNLSSECPRFERLPIGSFNTSNLAGAIRLAQLLDVSLQESTLRAAFSDIRLSGRQQIISESPWVMLDVGHNPDAMHSLAIKLQKTKTHKQGKTVAILGMLKDKDITSSIAELLPVIDEWHAVNIVGSPRAMDAHKVAGLVRAAGGHVVSEGKSVVTCFKRCFNEVTSQDRLVVVGSFLTVSPILEKYEDGTWIKG